MFNFLPSLKLNNGTVEVDLFDHRQDGDQHNIDFVRVVTYDEDGSNPLETQFGIQGKSDHLAAQRAKRNEQEATRTAEQTVTVSATDAETVEPVAA